MNRPRPVLTSAGIAGLITSVAGVLAFLGYANEATSLSGEAQGIAATAVAALGIGSHLLAALHAQGKVTPLADPRDHDGTKLVAAPYTAALYTGVGPAPTGTPLTWTTSTTGSAPTGDTGVTP